MFSSKDLFFTPAASGAYTVSKSLRFRSGSTTYLNRTPTTPTSGTTWTWSGWIKRGALGSAYFGVFGAGSNATTTYDALYYTTSTNTISFFIANGASLNLETTQVFRDPSAWYHLVAVYDSTQTTASDRAKLYINGVKVTAFSTATYPTQNTVSAGINANGIVNVIGASRTTAVAFPYDGYMAEVNFLDGYPTVGGTTYNATTWNSLNVATLFGAYDTNGIWQPAAYTGNYGTNGYYLKFTDVGATSGANSGYGKDFAGSNYWTTNNFGTTSTATTYDSMLDSPTNATGDIGDYPVLNPLSFNSANVVDGNLAYLGANNTSTRATFAMPTSGKWYWELTPVNASPNYVGFGLMGASTTGTNNYGTAAAGLWGLYPTTTMYLSINGSAVNTTVSTPTLGVVFAAAYDADTGNFWIGYSSSGSGSPTWFNSTGGTTGNPATGANPVATISAQTLFPAVSGNDTTATKSAINFGQRPFALTVPSGYSSLNTQNLTTPTITNGAQYMAATTYAGNTGTQSITISSTNSGNNPLGTTFQPDFVWIKGRNVTVDHALFDVVRGTAKTLYSSASNAEVTNDVFGYLSAFNASGFTLVPGSTNADRVNGNYNYVGWQWKAGGTGVSNTSGSIPSTVSANTTAGFSVVTYTGTGANATVGHGLGVAPSMILIKDRDSSSNGGAVYHTSLGATQYLKLFQTTTGTDGFATDNTVWNGGSPTFNSSVFSIGTNARTNSTDKYVAWCWAPIAGYSAFGSYTGNGLPDGPFVYTGFRPRWVLYKCSSTTATGWIVIDTSRDTYNLSQTYLQPNTSGAEGTSSIIDILSNGFKFRGVTSADTNASGGTYIYAAFAENPFRIARAR
jgi:hypothetical protein